MQYITNLRYIGINIYPVYHQSQQFLTHAIKLQHLIIQKNIIIISINYKIYFYHTQQILILYQIGQMKILHKI